MALKGSHSKDMLESLFERIRTQPTKIILIVLFVMTLNLVFSRELRQGFQRNLLLLNWTRFSVDDNQINLIANSGGRSIENDAMSDVAGQLAEMCINSKGRLSLSCAHVFGFRLDTTVNHDDLANMFDILKADPTAQIMLAIFAGRRYYILGEVERAKDIWSRWLLPDIHVWLARELLQQEDLSTAQSLIELLDIDYVPSTLTGRAQLASVSAIIAQESMLSGNPVLAEELWRRATRQLPNRAVFHSGLGQALAGQRRFDEAIIEHRLAISLDPDRPFMYVRLARALVQLERREEAIDITQKALELDPTHAGAKSLLKALKETKVQ